jgi:penicillin G amidase
MGVRWGRWLLGGLAAITAAGVAGYVYVRGSLPQLDGSLDGQGVSAQVDIQRDQRGIPHITAQNWPDAAYALGFVHGQDRLWQLEMNRRVGQGRLAELLGEAALETDIFLRTLGLYRRAQADVALLDPETRAFAERYAAGVNAAVAARRGPLPPEFLMLRTGFAPWTVADSLVWLKLMSLDLGYQWRAEINRLQLLTRLTPDQLWQMLPPYPGDAPLPLPDLATLAPDLPGKVGAAAAPPPPEAKGSNNWVLAGGRTVSGKPLLANDPHLNLTAPSIWYLVHLNVAGEPVVGASLPSLPFVVLGRTSRTAWGFTNTGPDVQDLIIERLASGVTSRSETIAVSGSKSVTITVRETANGPILSDALPKLAPILGKDHGLALRWTALEPGDTTLTAGRLLMRARDWPAAKAALSLFRSPQQNIVYADVDGNIGFIAAGKVPIRKPENRTHGLMPVPGWTGEADWIGSIPFEQLPQSFNPASGYVATANSRITAPGYPYVITNDLELPDRKNRIDAMIEAKPRHDMASMMAMQADLASQPLMALRDALLAQPGLPVQHKVILDGLRRWNGVVSGDRWEPAVLHAWNKALVTRLTQDDLGPLFKDMLRLRQPFVTATLRGAPGSERWCDDQGTQVAETCPAQTARALDDALAELGKAYGHADVTRWRWDALHHAVNAHRPFDNVPVLRRLFSLRVPRGGASSTVDVAHPTLRGERPYDAELAASYRAVYDLSDLDASLYVIPTGQSGNPLSPFYADQMPLWAQNSYFTIPTAPAEVAKIAQYKLSLRPALRKTD